VNGKAKGVEINGKRAARAGDPANCPGPQDHVVTDSASVTWNNKPAVRATSLTAHGGMVLLGSGNVFIGGPSAGGTVGNPDAAEKACEAAAAGRHPPPGTVYPKGDRDGRDGQPVPGGRCKQDYNNCGIEASRILINQAKGTSYNQEEMLDHAIDHDEARGSKDPEKRYNAGGSTAGDRQDLLNDYGVESTTEPQDMDTIAQAVADGKGVITSHGAGVLWGETPHLFDGHSVVTTGVTYGPDGKIVSVTVLDTGKGNCAYTVPVDQYKNSLRSFVPANVTKQRIWPE